MEIHNVLFLFPLPLAKAGAAWSKINMHQHTEVWHRHRRRHRRGWHWRRRGVVKSTDRRDHQKRWWTGLPAAMLIACSTLDHCCAVRHLQEMQSRLSKIQQESTTQEKEAMARPKQFAMSESWQHIEDHHSPPATVWHLYFYWSHTEHVPINQFFRVLGHLVGTHAA